MIDRGRRNLLGIAISAVDYEYAVDKIIEDAKAGRRCATTALAVHGVITGALDRAHRYRLNTFDLVTPDGQPVRWALNLLYGTKLNDRVYGPTMTLKVCKEAALQGIPVYFYGSSQQVLDKLCARLPEMCPGLKIAGAHPSEFRKLSAEEQKLAADRIRESGAKIVFVGLGCPRQEVFTYQMSTHLSMPMLAVGAAFDYHAGLLEEPPALLQTVWFAMAVSAGTGTGTALAAVTCSLTASSLGCSLLNGFDCGGRSWGIVILLWQRFGSAERFFGNNSGRRVNAARCVFGAMLVSVPGSATPAKTRFVSRTKARIPRYNLLTVVAPESNGVTGFASFHIAHGFGQPALSIAGFPHGYEVRMVPFEH